MNLASWFTTPPPATAWSLDEAAVIAVRRDRRGLCHCALQEVPGATFELGPVGLQSIDSAQLEAVVRNVQERVAGTNRPAVVVPTGWLRSHLLDFDQLPRKRAEIEDVIRWRLKRLLPVPPAELRIAWVQLVAGAGDKRLLTTVALRRPLDALEETLERTGLQPGLITSRAFALAINRRADDAGAHLVVQGEPGFLSLLLLVGGGPQLLRTKPVRLAADAAGVVRRELDLTLNYIRESLGTNDVLRVSVAVHDEATAASVHAWVEETAGLEKAPPPAAVETAEVDVVGRIGMPRLAPLQAVLGGAA